MMPNCSLKQPRINVRNWIKGQNERKGEGKEKGCKERMRVRILIMCTCLLIPEVGKGKHRPLVQ